MRQKKSVTCAILAGGASRRFGENKLALEFCGKSFLQHIVATLTAVSENIIVAGENCENLNVAPYLCFCDRFALHASIVGIHTALCHAPTEAVLVVAGDLPLLKVELLQLLISRFFSTKSDAVVPVVNNYMEPLVAVYARKNRAVIEENIYQRKLKIADFIGRINTSVLSEKEVRAVDPELQSFLNINTPHDYRKLLDKFSTADKA
ncbi:MAG TPA: molybdenum cofactor guanylyltransferase [Candidatus Aminicenantes bacterium]|nr:molybdenum cofactor guanylyltransferase [Candidatus Aminicenantes bacterium]